VQKYKDFEEYSLETKSRALRRVWHKPERIVEANVFFALGEMYESNTMGRLCFFIMICI
jgi:hypothetical protein